MSWRCAWRTRSGREVAKRLGRKSGRKSKMTGINIKSVKKPLANGVPPTGVAKNFGVSKRWRNAVSTVSAAPVLPDFTASMGKPNDTNKTGRHMMQCSAIPAGAWFRDVGPTGPSCAGVAVLDGTPPGGVDAQR